METTLDTEEIKQEVAGFGALQKTSRLDYLLKIKNLKDLLIKEIIYHKNLLDLQLWNFLLLKLKNLKILQSELAKKIKSSKYIQKEKTNNIGNFHYQ